MWHTVSQTAVNPHIAGDSVILSSGIWPVHLCRPCPPNILHNFENEYAFQSIVVYNSFKLRLCF